MKPLTTLCCKRCGKGWLSLVLVTMRNRGLWAICCHAPASCPDTDGQQYLIITMPHEETFMFAWYAHMHCTRLWHYNCVATMLCSVTIDVRTCVRDWAWVFVCRVDRVYIPTRRSATPETNIHHITIFFICENLIGLSASPTARRGSPWSNGQLLDNFQMRRKQP